MHGECWAELELSFPSPIQPLGLIKYLRHPSTEAKCLRPRFPASSQMINSNSLSKHARSMCASLAFSSTVALC